MHIEVNNRPIEAQAGETILAALRRAGVSVPTLCHMEGLLPSGACRICAVEVEGQRSLIPACSYPVAEGMKIRTHSPRAVAARRTIIELLLSNHPDDCLYCVRNTSCQLQTLAAEHGVTQRRFSGLRSNHTIDISGPALGRDPAKCILCGKCVRECEEVQSVAAIDFIGRGSATRVGPAFNEGLNLSSCILCGQCVMVCPTGALFEQSHLRQVMAAIQDPEMTVVIQHAPAVSVTLAEAFGLPPGQDMAGTMTAALRRLGFDQVFDTSFSADLTIMEEASELVQRLTSGGILPMMTSCSPGWIKFMEEFYPDMLGHLSTCKSPQQMLGAVIKSYWAPRQGLDPTKVFSVAVMPCTAKKFEASRPEMVHDGVADIDAVLTTRELVQLIRMHGLDMLALPPEPADRPFGERSTAGKLFGGSGGVMEAAIRTACFLVTGKDPEALEVEAVRGLHGVKQTRVKVGELELGVAVVSGLGNARKLVEQVRAGRDDLHFIEVMTCPGGCIAGGGQLLGVDRAGLERRLAGLYAIDAAGAVRMSHHNEAVAELYREFLGQPLGERSHHLLHTHYHRRDVVK
ncbi:MAG TPA: NADH-dependent [FeFe] hydrogenase, group A6 [Thermoanaerobaculaceae bacterium]|nr:NADH-dependent [FeFe] hydrogenase, group A6 [Thermoanaerobaculaceae bacterium]HRS15512.1 NADH-dependent [FeFe] hydrogenase, group A6 [Thermoanaerobaculaceae bacterium]